MERENEGNSTDEIEITPEMVEAGKIALAAYSPYFHLEEEGVIAIYMAMASARNQGR